MEFISPKYKYYDGYHTLTEERRNFLHYSLDDEAMNRTKCDPSIPSREVRPKTRKAPEAKKEKKKREGKSKDKKQKQKSEEELSTENVGSQGVEEPIEETYDIQ